jgi:hypothetical protein
MNKLISDLKYLLRGCNSFGGVYSSPTKLVRAFSGLDISNTTPKTPKTPANAPKIIGPVDTEIIYKICNIDFHIYHYPSYTKGNCLIMSTPGEVNTTESTKCEGPHHPVCKIEGTYQNEYRDYTMSEDFVIFKGKKIVRYDKNNNYICENGDCDQILLLGVLVACYCSLVERLDFYIRMLKNKDTINEGHINAPFKTIERIKNILSKLKSTNYHNCALKFLISPRLNFGRLQMIYREFKNYSEDPYDSLHDYILKMYEKYLTPGGKVLDIPKPVKPKKVVDPIAKRLF